MATATLPRLRAPFRWEGDHVAADLPGARALFTTRRGGVSERAVRLAQPRPADRRRQRQRQREPGARGGRHRLPARALPVRQAGPRRHRAPRHRAARPGPAARPTRTARRRRCAGHPALVFVADCTPVVLAAEGAVATLHVGWRPAAAGIVAEGVAALREVGGHRPDHRADRPGRARLLLRGRRGGPRRTSPATTPAAGAQPRPPGRHPRAARRRARCTTSGCARCAASACSSRTAATAASPAARQGSHGALITGSTPAASARTSRACARSCPTSVQILAAVKYVPLEELGTLAEAGIELVGENRAQDLEAKADAHPEFRWHFIGQLQSRKVKLILPHVELIHSVASDSALRQLERHGTPEHEDPRRGQRRRRGGQGGDRAGRAGRLHRPLPGHRDRPDDDAALHRGPRGQPPALRRPQAAGRRARPRPSSRWAPRRTTASPPRRARRSCAWVPSCTRSREIAPRREPIPAHGLPRHLAPHARLLRPRRGP